MNIKQLKKLIANLPDDTWVLGTDSFKDPAFPSIPEFKVKLTKVMAADEYPQPSRAKDAVPVLFVKLRF